MGGQMLSIVQTIPVPTGFLKVRDVKNKVRSLEINVPLGLLKILEDKWKICQEEEVGAGELRAMAYGVAPLLPEYRNDLATICHLLGRFSTC